jgi:ATP-binding cassette subfamily C (CFTR/MRP) protein 1
MVIRAANQALAFSIPVLASVVSFAAYSLGGGHKVDPAVIFTSLSYFMLLRQPRKHDCHRYYSVNLILK